MMRTASHLVLENRPRAPGRKGFSTVSVLLLLFALVFGGQVGNDLVSLMPAEDYFQSRTIDTSVDKLVELAGKDPTDGKTRIQQLLALRMLGEDADKLKKAKGFAEHRQVIADIAAGKKAQDNLGFAQEYAAWVLAQLDGKDLVQPAQKGKLRETAGAWFPDDVKIIFAVDFAGDRPRLGQTKEIRDVVDQVVKNIPAREKAEIYNMVEQTGNVRLDSFALSFRYDAQNTQNDDVYIRVSGKGNHELLLAFLMNKNPNALVEKSKGANKEQITLIQSDPATALIGNSDIIVAGKKRLDNNSIAVVKEMLDVRSGKRPNILKGPLSEELKKVSDKANGLAVGSLSPDMIQGLMPPRGPLEILPRAFVMETQKQAKSLDVRFEGKFTGADEAKAFIEAGLKLRGSVLIELKLNADKLPFPVDDLRKALVSIKTEAKQGAVVGSAQVPTDGAPAILKALGKTIQRDN